jgi:lipopolysaccharide biosynthesis glycosyltransferase
MSTLRVACAPDTKYVPHAAAMIHSVLTYNPWDEVEIHLLHGDDLRAGTLRRVRAMVERAGGTFIPLKVPDRAVAGLKTTRIFPRSIWYRTFLPELVGASRILYLDSDTITLQPLRELWETDLTNRHLAAVTNVFQREEEKRRATILGISPERYFNSGVLLLNLERLRSDGSMTSVRRYALQHPERLGWPEQDAINAVLAEFRVDLHPKWNCMNSVTLWDWAADVFGAKAVEEARRSPAIRHFEGPGQNKPWHIDCAHEMKDLYRRHRRATPWPFYVPEGLTLRGVLSRVTGQGMMV